MPASLELVKIALQAYGNGDSEIALALAGPQVRWDERASRPDGNLVWGHDKVQRAMRRYHEGWETYRFELEDIAEVGPGKVVGICRERGKPKDSVAIDRRFGGLWIVDTGKIVSWTTFLTPREAVRAAKGLAGPEVKRTQPEPVAAPARTILTEQVEIDSPQPVEPEEPEPFDFEAPDPAPAPVAERPRKRALTKSEEQKRAARARAMLRRRSSRKSA